MDTEKLALAGGTLTGQLITDNLGIEFEDSDTNPACAAGNYNIFADLSETTLKKCINGVATVLDTTGGTPSFDQVTAGTNTAALVMGTGGTLGVSGSGTIAATSVPWSGISSVDAEVAALAGVTSATDRLFYFTGSGTGDLATFTSAGRAILDDANASAQRTTLGLVIGTNVQAEDTELTQIAGLSCSNDQILKEAGGVWTCAADATAGSGTFLGLTDTPGSFTAGRFVRANAGATALVEDADFYNDLSNDWLFFGNRTYQNFTPVDNETGFFSQMQVNLPSGTLGVRGFVFKPNITAGNNAPVGGFDCSMRSDQSNGNDSDVGEHFCYGGMHDGINASAVAGTNLFGQDMHVGRQSTASTNIGLIGVAAGVHSETALQNAIPSIGMHIWSADSGPWAPTLRAGSAIQVEGDTGFEWAFRYFTSGLGNANNIEPNYGVDQHGRILLTETAEVGNPGANKLFQYSKDSGGTTIWCYRDSAGTETCPDEGGGSAVVALSVVVGDGVSVVPTGVVEYLEVPFACTINRVTMLADQSGSLVVDIWKDTYANYPPLDADSITASAVPTITTAVKSQDSTLTGWTTAVTAGDILAFNVDSSTTITQATVSLKCTK